jgi:hypothetical protein
MGNIVPQLSNFNHETWKEIEDRLRYKYEGMTILKGGKYTGRTMKNNIQVSDGFYWIVINNNEIIDNGYIDQFTEIESKDLPSWIIIDDNPQPEDKSIYAVFIVGGLLLFITCGCLLGSLFGKCKKTNKVDDFPPFDLNEVSDDKTVN